MKGRCNGCGNEYPANRLPGYNVRLGKIEDAVCHSCLAYYMNVREGLGPGWFSTVLRKILGAKRKTERTGNVIQFPGAKQTTIEEHLNGQ